VPYLAVRSLDPKGTGQVRWIARWKSIFNVTGMSFQNRMPEPPTYRTPVTPFPGAQLEAGHVALATDMTAHV
jgi:hypothetical protein